MYAVTPLSHTQLLKFIENQLLETELLHVLLFVSNKVQQQESELKKRYKCELEGYCCTFNFMKVSNELGIQLL